MFEHEGMPKHEQSGEYGNLFLKINVKMPEKLTESQIKGNFTFSFYFIIFILVANEFFKRRSNW